MKQLCSLLFLLVGMLQSQITVTSIQRLPIPKSEQWTNARFSPDGQSIFVTNSDANGIWEYSLTNNVLRVITDDQRSGFGFTFSSDGSTIGYRTTVKERDGNGPRVQEAITVDLRSLEKRTLETNNSVEIPFFVSNKAASRKTLVAVPQSSKSTIAGTDNSGIVLVKDGTIVSVDPFKGGQYIWPVISPDGKKLTAVEMSRGAFICDIDGKNVIRIGRCNTPQWSHDGKWVIGMNDVDDGHVITGSDVLAVSVDGTTKINLTNSPNAIELFPSVHPYKKEIAVTTSSGDLLLIKYTEGK